MFGKFCKNKVSEHAKEIIQSDERNPSLTRIKVEVVNALTHKESTLFESGGHPPEKLGLTDLNKKGNKVPFWTASTIDKNGNKQNVVCCNAEAALDILQEQHKHATGNKLLGRMPETLAKFVLKQSNLNGSQCVLEKTTQENGLNLSETFTLSEKRYSAPPSPSRPDNTHYPTF